MNIREVRFNTLKHTLNILYEELLKPITRNEEDFRKELVCNTILLFIIGLVLVLNLLVIYSLVSEGGVYDGIPFSLSFTITAGFAGLLCISRLGYSRVIGWILIHLLILGCVYAEIKWGIDLPSVILLWCFIITATSILLSTRYALILSVAIGTSSIILVILEQNNIYSPMKSWKVEDFILDDAIEYSFILILIAGVSWLSNREILHSFRKLKDSRDELQKERDTLEIRVTERTEELQKLQAEKIHTMYRFVEFGRLSSGLFHDLMNPLHALCLSVSSLKENRVNPDNNLIQSQIETALQASGRLEQFIQDTRKQIKVDIKNEVFSVSQEILSVVHMIKAKALSKDVEVVYTPKHDILYFGSPTLFNHMIINLVSNAIDAYSDMAQEKRNILNKQKVSIKLKTETESIATKESIRDYYLAFSISIKDTGRGIPASIQDHIFNPFFTTKDKEGCGIGLSATKHTLEKYFNGTISFTSNKEYGTNFTLYFPSISDESSHKKVEHSIQS